MDATDGFFSLPAIVVTVGNNGLTFGFSTGIATCGNTDGSIQLTGSGGLAPYQYSIGGSYQTNNVFAAAGGNYTVTIKDAVGCMTSLPVVVPQNNNLVTDAGPDQLICEGANAVLGASSNARQI